MCIRDSHVTCVSLCVLTSVSTRHVFNVICFNNIGTDCFVVTDRGRQISVCIGPPKHSGRRCLNPVDCAVWGALQQMVYQRRRFTTINQLKQAVVTKWGKLQRFMDRAVGQWRRRFKWVVPQQGKQIEHLM